MKKNPFLFFTKTKHFKVIAILIFALLSTPVISYSQPPTKTIDFSSGINDVDQEYTYWCVYACWEARTGGSQDQCDACDYYVDTYVVDRYNSNDNPYPHIDNFTFNQTMADYVADITTPCGNKALYSDFGVLSNTLSSYLGAEIYTGSFVGSISDPDINYLNGPFFAISTDPLSGTGHCVLFVGSEVYNDDAFDPDSIVYIMDPDRGETISMTVGDFMDEYTQYFQ